MILTAHQPTYLPWLGFFDKVYKSEVYVLMDGVQFETNSFINRNKIYTKNGELWLTVPCLTKNHFDKTIREIEINNTINWRKKHWASLHMNYKKSAYFYLYSDFFEDMYSREWLYLNDLLEYQLEYLLEVLKIETKVIKLSQLNILSKKQELILDMCKKLDAKKFIFGALGEDYVDKNVFIKNNIDIEFQDYKHPKYNQLSEEFVSYMSIVDLLFNEGPERSMDIILGANNE
jgi:hypothetical protein